MKKLFLSHYSKHAREVHRLAEELRFRGVVPWVDKQGGFSVADDSAVEAERAIEEDCFGLLLYATPDVFEREFITHHEVWPALKKKRREYRYALFAVPRKITFGELGKESIRVYGEDLSRYHTHELKGDIKAKLALVANDVLRKVVAEAPAAHNGEISVQFSTFEAVPLMGPEILLIDGRSVYSPVSPSDDFDRLVHGMRDAKREISARYARPRIRVEGSKHLSAAFAFGRVFQPFELNVHQVADQYWKSDASFRPRDEFAERLEVDDGSELLAVEISSRLKELSSDVDEALKDRGAFSRLVLRPADPLDVDNELCCALVDQAYRAIERASIRTKAKEIHLFAAAPQALMMMLGKKFAGMPKTLAYDFREGTYGQPRVVPAGPL